MNTTYLIAIDFGTAYSGYAYSITSGNEEVKPQLRRWGQEFGQSTPKTPTCILFDENQVFKAFGYEAMANYLDMGREAKNSYYFRDFKMNLYNQKITKDLEIRDVNKKPMKALKVFSAALRFLKEEALKTAAEHYSNFEFTASDFTWVLTVPAIWDAPARQFMREAAEQAGIVSTSSPKKLVIALEPEGASVWCRKLPSHGFISESSNKPNISQTTGIQYVVVDCGGGTIDITVHEVLEGGALKELHRASGNNKGGQHVDKQFKECLREYFCQGQWDQYERDHPSEAQKLLNEFTIRKQFARKPTPLTLSCECKLEGIIQSNKTFKETKGFKWDDGKIVISQEKMESFFQDSLIYIEDSIKEILDKHGGIDYIMLVGGFAQCQILREMIDTEFSNKAKVLCPENPQEVIMKGALVFGCNQSVIRSRKSAYTYGTDVAVPFDPSKHKPEKKIITDCGEHCKDLFYKLVEIDEDVKWDETRDYSFSPLNKNATSATFNFYRTKRLSPTYVDDGLVEGPVASCVVAMPDTTKGLNRTIKLKVCFGATEITAKATDVESQSTASAKIDFITQ